MTMGETATAIASVGVLAQIGDGGVASGGVEWLVQLGVRGLLVVGIVVLWRRMERQDREQRAAEEKRHKEDQERNQLLLKVLLKLDERNGGNENKQEKE
jgi:hypothetical protein